LQKQIHNGHQNHSAKFWRFLEDQIKTQTMRIFSELQ
jgi:hypothetical protein